jgi:hypothetical protein
MPRVRPPVRKLAPPPTKTSWPRPQVVEFQDRLSGGRPQEVAWYARDHIDAVTAQWCAMHPEMFGMGRGVISEKRQQLFDDTRRADLVGERVDIMAPYHTKGLDATEALLMEHPDLQPESFVKLRACHLAFALLCEEMRAGLPASTYWMWRQSKIYGQRLTAIGASRGLGVRRCKAAIEEATAFAAELVRTNLLLRRLWEVARAPLPDPEDEEAAEDTLRDTSIRAQRLALAGKPLQAARADAEDFIRGVQALG